MENLTDRIRIKKEEIEAKQKELDSFQPDNIDYEDQFDEMLNYSYPKLFGMLPSRILYDCDRQKYYKDLNNFVYSMDIREHKMYIQLEKELDDLENELFQLELEGLG